MLFRRSGRGSNSSSRQNKYVYLLLMCIYCDPRSIYVHLFLNNAEVITEDAVVIVIMLCIYIYIHTYICSDEFIVCVYISLSIYIYIYTIVHIYIHVCMYIYIYIYIYMHTRLRGRGRLCLRGLRAQFSAVVAGRLAFIIILLLCSL